MRRRQRHVRRGGIRGQVQGHDQGVGLGIPHRDHEAGEVVAETGVPDDKSGELPMARLRLGKS